MDDESGRSSAGEQGNRAMYGRLVASLAASLAAMYLLAFSQLEGFDHFHLSLSVLWISLSMVAAMGLIMMVAMRPMFKDRHLNLVLFGVFGLLLVGAFLGSRLEALVGDEAFLRSMIPHHSRAIHMCQQASISDPDVQALCGQIIETQREEIRLMERMLEQGTA